MDVPVTDGDSEASPIVALFMDPHDTSSKPFWLFLVRVPSRKYFFLELLDPPLK
ncbi:MAG: hypothetical protein NTW27_03845 [Deltaproteobacteria bacterium]|nr:hypothetical protein [Deltaproteobacteria bacterium]